MATRYPIETNIVFNHYLFDMALLNVLLQFKSPLFHRNSAVGVIRYIIYSFVGGHSYSSTIKTMLRSREYYMI